MTPEEKQSELKRHREILMATLDYSIERYRAANAGLAGYNLIGAFERIKPQIDAHFQKGNLTRLKQDLRDLTAEYRETGDLNFGRYIKETTGYDIDIFGSFQKRIDKIIERKKIITEHQYREVDEMVNHLCQEMPGDQKKIDILNNLLIDYEDKRSGTKTPKSKCKVSTTDNYFVMEIAAISSPNNNRKLTITETRDENYTQTQVMIQFETGGGAGVYSIYGTGSDLEAAWEDNNTIIIETKAGIESSQKWEQVQSFDKIVEVKYVEK